MKITKTSTYVLELSGDEYTTLVDALGEGTGAYDIYAALDDAR